MFPGGRPADDYRRNAQQMRDAAVRHGRRADDVRFIVQAGVVVGRTEEEAADKVRAYREHTSVEGILAHNGVPFDLPAYEQSTTLEQVAEAESAAGHPFFRMFAPGTTVGAALTDLAGGREGRFFVAGTPTVVADEIERWLDDDGIDGINLRQYHSFDTARDFVELVVPELRRRGRLRDGYVPGETLRERLFGADRGPRLPDRHTAARYRGGANLDNPVAPLTFG
ncbi:LLM class flavin-dependent oxidoreductase [Marisediminicola senii]|uniref:LLM class flavin-dependent oxidoreductase n=1 Tax=Marisediminicola senii TaxID=2711233 RepID=UPI001F2D8267